jgi:hypothetical protein
MQRAQLLGEQIHFRLRFAQPNVASKATVQTAAWVLAVTKHIAARMQQRLVSKWKPEIRHIQIRAHEVARRDPNDAECYAIQLDRFADQRRITSKSSLPIIFADQYAGW